MGVDWLDDRFAVILSLALVRVGSWDALDDGSDLADGWCFNDRHMWLDDALVLGNVLNVSNWMGEMASEGN